MEPREDSMLHWLALVCSEARRARGRKQANVAASVGVDSATIGRFERGMWWPRDPDATVAAYADDLDMDARDLWAEAIRRWIEEGDAPTL